jgi:hypothetical protein
LGAILLQGSGCTLLVGIGLLDQLLRSGDMSRQQVLLTDGLEMVSDEIRLGRLNQSIGGFDVGLLQGLLRPIVVDGGLGRCDVRLGLRH